MVGVGGRGKGCRTCVRRHLKCDEAKPTCKRCLKAKLYCGGYKEQTFISFEGSGSGIQRIDEEKPIQALLCTSRKPLLDWLGPIPINLPAASRYSDRICVSYARAHLPSAWDEDGCWSIADLELMDGKSAVEHNLVQCTLLSLARTLFAYRFNIGGLLEEGFRLYRQVLAAIHQALGLPNVPERKEVLECILALRLFDSFVPFHPGAWVQHSLGVERVLELQGPESYKDPASRKHLTTAKMLVTMAAIHQGRPNALASARWKNLEISSELHYNPLMDTFADLPNILYDRQQQIKHDSPAETMQATSDRAIDLLQELILWRRMWNMPNPASCYPTTEAWPKGVKRPSWSGSGLAFTTPKQAKQVMTWDSIVLISIMSTFPSIIQYCHIHENDSICEQDIDSLVSQLDEAVLIGLTPLTEAGLLRLFHLALSEACRSTHYYFSQDLKQDHPIDMLMPLRHVWLNTRKIKCQMSSWLSQTMQYLAKEAPEGSLLISEPIARPGMGQCSGMSPVGFSQA